MRRCRFRAGQLSHQQERQGIADEQQVLTEQFYPPVYRNFMLARWQRWSSDHSELQASDMDLLRYPRFILRTYQVLDKGRLVAADSESLGGGTAHVSGASEPNSGMLAGTRMK